MARYTIKKKDRMDSDCSIINKGGVFKVYSAIWQRSAVNRGSKWKDTVVREFDDVDKARSFCFVRAKHSGEIKEKKRG